MNEHSRTLRLILPQWQGGVNPDYAFGAEVLAFIAPPSSRDEVVTVPVSRDFDAPLETRNGIDGEDVLLVQLCETARILDVKNPDKVIVFGGDCAISQAPFDYLSGKYKEHLGILWFDAHPDIATPETSTHSHEMVLGNILGRGAPGFSAQMRHPVDPNRVLYAGLIEKELRPKDGAVHSLGLKVAGPDSIKESSDPVVSWLREHKITRLAVHLDLDVLSPQDFRSILPAEPYLSKEDFGAAVGEMTLDQVVRVLRDASVHAEIVGLCIAEHMPWDALRLRAALRKIPIFAT